MLQGLTFYHCSYFTTESYERFVTGFHGSSTESYMNNSRSHSYKVSGPGNEPLSSGSLYIALTSRWAFVPLFSFKKYFDPNILFSPWCCMKNSSCSMSWLHFSYIFDLERKTTCSVFQLSKFSVEKLMEQFYTSYWSDLPNRLENWNLVFLRGIKI